MIQKKLWYKDWLDIHTLVENWINTWLRYGIDGSRPLCHVELLEVSYKIGSEVVTVTISTDIARKILDIDSSLLDSSLVCIAEFKMIHVRVSVVTQ